MYERFERDARVALGLARRNAEQGSAARIDTGHLLCALLATLGPVRARLIYRGVTGPRLREALRRVPPEAHSHPIAFFAQLPFSATLQRALERARAEPRVDGLALLRALGSVAGRASRALRALGVDAYQVGQDVPPLPALPLPALPALPLADLLPPSFAAWEQLATLSGGRLTAGAALCGLLRDHRICAALRSLGVQPTEIQQCSPPEVSGSRRGELRIEARRDLGLQAGLIFLSGRFQGPAAREHLRRELASEREAGTRWVLLDLSWVQYLDSGGLGSLVAEADRFQAAGGKLLLLGVPAKVRVVIEILGLEPYLPSAASVSEGWRRLGLLAPPMVAPPRVARALAIARREEQRHGLSLRGALLIGLLAVQPRANGLLEAKGCSPDDLRQSLGRRRAPQRRRAEPSAPSLQLLPTPATRATGTRPPRRQTRNNPALTALLTGGLAAGLAALLASWLG